MVDAGHEVGCGSQPRSGGGWEVQVAGDGVVHCLTSHVQACLENKKQDQDVFVIRF